MAGPERAESRLMLKHWRRFRGDKRLPFREDIRLGDLTEFTPHIFVLDIEGDDRFIIRRLGSAVVERFGGLELTGVNLLDLTHPALRDRVIARVRMIFEFGYAACTHMGMPSTNGRVKRSENLMLPVESSTGEFRQVFGTLYYVDGPDETALHTLNSQAVAVVDESFIDLGSGYAAVIDASELPLSAFPGKPNPET